MKKVILSILIIFAPYLVHSQFIDNFDTPKVPGEPGIIPGWTAFAGDGSAIVRFEQKEDYASVLVDATHDTLNIWWALIKHGVSDYLDLGKLSQPGYELRIEARVRVSQAPRRINLSLNTQRTTDFHSNLMEFYIDDTADWHIVSFTTTDFDAIPGDKVNAQMALMDWGQEQYAVDIDYFKVELIDTHNGIINQGIHVPYRPPVKEIDSLSSHIPVIGDCTIDNRYPEKNFNNWYAMEEAKDKTALLNVSNTQYILLRWDLRDFKLKKASGPGVLELTTYSVMRSSDFEKDFGMIRLVEIIGGDQNWDQQTVTWHSFFGDYENNKVINGQMIIDIAPAESKGDSNYINIPQPVLQRMLEGKTKGIAILPLGSINAAFYSIENNKPETTPQLHFSATE
jgi:hypothetical protein